MEEAVLLALEKMAGAYAIVLMNKEEPTTLIAAGKDSPLVTRVAPDGYFLASDVRPIIEYTNQVIYLDDYEIAVIHDQQLHVKSIENIETHPYIAPLEMNLETIGKGGYEHFILKEII